MKITVLSFAVNTKFPIDTQYRQFQKHCFSDDYEFVVLNDAFLNGEARKISELTKYFNINCVRVPQDIHAENNPSQGYAGALNWAVKTYALEKGCEVVLLVHSDVFPYTQLSMKDVIGDNVVASLMERREYQGRAVDYFYPALTMVNVKELGPKIHELDFSCAVGLDTGGKSFEFIQNNQNLKMKFMEHHQIPNVINSLSPGMQEYLNQDIEICAEYGLNKGWISEGFYHYLAGSQWNLEYDPRFAEGHNKRMALFLKYFY